MNTLKDIFDKIKGRPWDWFKNLGDVEVISFPTHIGGTLWSGVKFEYERGGEEKFSLADLLANKSWSKCVWGERHWTCNDSKSGCPHYPDEDHRRYDWIVGSANAFTVLQQEGKQACLDYITTTMI